jgi:hypothetical protein
MRIKMRKIIITVNPPRLVGLFKTKPNMIAKINQTRIMIDITILPRNFDRSLCIKNYPFNPFGERNCILMRDETQPNRVMIMLHPSSLM